MDETPTPAGADTSKRGGIAGPEHGKDTPRAGASDENRLQQFLADMYDDIYQGLTRKAG